MDMSTHTPAPSVPVYQVDTEMTSKLAQALSTILALIPSNMELFIYRDDDEPSVLETTYPDGRTEVNRATDRLASGPLEVNYPHHPDPPTLATWRQVAIEPPPELTDVILLQVLHGMAPEDSTVQRIGYLNKAGQFVDTYGTGLDGGDMVLTGITHWAPQPADPILVEVAP